MLFVSFMENKGHYRVKLIIGKQGVGAFRSMIFVTLPPAWRYVYCYLQIIGMEKPMAKVDTLVKDFLAQKRIAVVGISDKRDTGCNLVYKNFKNNGYQVYAVNPRITSFEGEACYPNLGSIPEKPEAVFILASPKVTDQVVQQCVDLGIKHVWMHCMMGVKPGLNAGMTSVSQSAVAMCKANGIQVIPGSCPNQYIGDFGHAMMRGMWRLLGFMNMN
jgi:predicted CoA-binding protein